MYQFYIMELQQYQDGSYGNLVHVAYDEDEETAKLKAEAKYHEIQAEAALSQIPGHGAIILSSKGETRLYKYYRKGHPDHQDVFQYYIFEFQKYNNGEYGHLVHYAYDADQNMARLKGESKFYQVLSAAAVSGLPEHAAVLVTHDCYPVAAKCYPSANGNVVI